MPLYGIDVSHWRGDVDWASVHSSGISYAFAKVSEGVDFTDPKWERNRSQMVDLPDFLPGAYHFLRGDADIRDQVDYFLERTGDLSGLAVALDVETREGAEQQATREQALEWVTEFRRRTDDHPVFGYYPQWYWNQTGRGDLSFFDTLWASHYVDGSGTPEELYPKVPAEWWDGYGSASVSILQFSSSGNVPGVPPPTDLDAYRGTLSDLRALALPRP